MSEAFVPQPFEPTKSDVSLLSIQNDPPRLEIVNRDESETNQIESYSGFGKWLTAAKRAGQMALIGIEMTPGINEGARAALFGASEIITHGNPIAAGVIAGVSTFAIEAAGGLAGASLLETDQAAWLMQKAEGASDKMKIPSKLSTTTKLGFTFLGGTNVGMFLEQRENPYRTLAENRKYNWLTSAWLGGSLAVAGVLSAEGINVGVENPQTAGVIAGGVAVAAGGRWVKKRLTFKRVEPRTEGVDDIDNKHGYSFGYITDPEKLKRAGELEAQVWKQKGFGSLDEYAEYIAYSRTFAGFEDNGSCVGLLRLFGGEKTVPPFLDMEYFNETTQTKEKVKYFDDAEKEQFVSDSRAGLVEEVGTLAKRDGTPRGTISNRLYRLAYRDARNRNVRKWGCIMEPERVAKMNKYSGFTFRQIGETVQYQGGDCAPFIMSLDETFKNLTRKNPIASYWFVKKRLHS